MAISLKLKGNGTVTPTETGFEVCYPVQIIGETGSVLGSETLTVPVAKPDDDVAALGSTAATQFVAALALKYRTQGVLEEKARLALPVVQAALTKAAKTAALTIAAVEVK
jgi:hypothetical protein